MNYKGALSKLESFRKLVERAYKKQGTMDLKSYDQLYIQYGEVEEIINRIVGVEKILVPVGGGANDTICSNYIEAGFLTGRTFYQGQGYAQLLKIIGKVKQLSEDPDIPELPMSAALLLRILRKFRECCQYIQNPPKNEKEVQDILWIMLRSQFERLEREETLPKFGTKAYRPDFGLPELGILVEVKYIGEKTSVPKIQEEILADLPGYLNDDTKYTGSIALVYDNGHKLRDPRKFIEDLRNIDGILDVLVIPGIGL